MHKFTDVPLNKRGLTTRLFSGPKTLSWLTFRRAMNALAQLKIQWPKGSGRKMLTLKIPSGPSSHSLWARPQLRCQLQIRVRFVPFKERYLQWLHTASDLGKGIGNTNAKLASTAGKWIRFTLIRVILTTNPMDRAGEWPNVKGCQGD